jgi:hypothetical protein
VVTRLRIAATTTTTLTRGARARTLVLIRLAGLDQYDGGVREEVCEEEEEVVVRAAGVRACRGCSVHWDEWFGVGARRTDCISVGPGPPTFFFLLVDLLFFFC